MLKIKERRRKVSNYCAIGCSQAEREVIMKKKSKTPYIIGGAAGLGVIALVFILVFTNVFGLLNKADGDTIKTALVIDGVKQKITSVRLDSEKAITLKAGDICHFVDEEKQSIPYRWQYYISDENLISVFCDEYADKTLPGAADGGDNGLRRIFFKALAPGECVITVRYEDVRDAELYSGERMYTVKITAGGETG